MADEVNEIPTRLEYLRKRIQPVLQEPTRTHILVGAAALCVGAGIGYILGKRNKFEAVVEVTPPNDIHADPNQMKFEFDSHELAEELAEIRETLEEVRAKRLRAEAMVDGDDIRPGLVVEEERESHADLVIKDDFDVADFVAEKLREQSPTSAGALDQEDEPLVRGSIFAADDDDWNSELEMMSRSTTAPYILHKDEFYAEEKGYTQNTLTYYAGDEIMADEEEAPIYNHEKVTGPLKFGHGSGDQNVVYIRNDRLKAEYEILLDSGLYSEEVLGLDIPNNARLRDTPRDRDLRHSNFRKFRDED